MVEHQEKITIEERNMRQGSTNQIEINMLTKASMRDKEPQKDMSAQDAIRKDKHS